MVRPLLRPWGAWKPSPLLARSCQHARFYSVIPQAASHSKPQDIDPRKLVIEKTTTPGTLVKPEDLIFGKYFTGRCTLSRDFSHGL
jgi:branched-chain amino acid aminotransferase